MIRKLFLSFVLTFSLCGVYAQENEVSDEVYRDYVDRIVELTKLENTYAVVIPQIFSMMRQQLPEVPEEFWVRGEKKFSEQVMARISDMLLMVYKQFYTVEDLEALIRFYQTPTGQKMAENNGQISAMMYQYGQEWGRQIGEGILQDLRNEGYVKEM